MAFKVLPSRREDIYTLTEIFQKAFATDPEFLLMYRNCDREEVVRADFGSFEKDFDVPGRRYFKAVDENGVIVGMSKWWFPYMLTPEQEAAGVGKNKLPESWPKGAEVELCKEFFGKIYESRRRMLNHEKDYFVNILAVRPEYQRKGIGGVLLEDGLKNPDSQCRRTFVEASKKGSGLYLKHGWKEVGKIQFDTRPWGGEVEETKLMFRDPVW